MAPDWMGYLMIGLTVVVVVALVICGSWRGKE